MYDTHAYALGCYVTVDQLAVSQRAARAVEHRQAVREQKLERKAQRQQRRALRRSQEAYTTAV
jgi:hypothetical protein